MSILDACIPGHSTDSLRIAHKHCFGKFIVVYLISREAIRTERSRVWETLYILWRSKNKKPRERKNNNKLWLDIFLANKVSRTDEWRTITTVNGQWVLYNTHTHTPTYTVNERIMWAMRFVSSMRSCLVPKIIRHSTLTAVSVCAQNEEDKNNKNWGNMRKMVKK